MKSVLLGMMAAAAMALLPAVAAASECETRGLAGTWLMGSGSDMLCAVEVRRNGRYVASCLRSGEGRPVTLEGRMTLNGQCILRMSGDRVGLLLEGRAWATNEPARIDAFQGTMDWKVEEGLSWVTVSGHRRPNAGRLPID